MSSHVSGVATMLIVAAGLLSACSGDDDGPVSTARTGRFVDSAVEGLAYVTATGQGLTNASGEFTYMPGESVTFSIGDIRLPTIQDTELITPLSVWCVDFQANFGDAFFGSG